MGEILCISDLFVLNAFCILHTAAIQRIRKEEKIENFLDICSCLLE